jgi:mono/diheme cytochrome c family protein
MNKRLPVVALVVAVALIVTKSALAAEGEIPPTVVEEGHRTYLNLCASCHGKSGKGDGSMVPELVHKPIDLTQIARKNNGNFPFWHVYQTIDGRRIPRAHGGPEMPLWGGRSVMFYHSIANREWILAVTFYLESIQAK